MQTRAGSKGSAAALSQPADAAEISDIVSQPTQQDAESVEALRKSVLFSQRELHRSGSLHKHRSTSLHSSQKRKPTQFTGAYSALHKL